MPHESWEEGFQHGGCGRWQVCQTRRMVRTGPISLVHNRNSGMLTPRATPIRLSS